MTIDQDRVRQLAYQIWESEGKPEGQEARHWEMARKLAEAGGEEAAAALETVRGFGYRFG